MAFKYSESEKFRANIFLSAGFLIMTPLGILALNAITEHRYANFWSWLIGLILFCAGYLLIEKSYDMMEKRDNMNYDG